MTTELAGEQADICNMKIVQFENLLQLKVRSLAETAGRRGAVSTQLTAATTAAADQHISCSGRSC